jgi:hypothetical protein
MSAFNFQYLSIQKGPFKLNSILKKSLDLLLCTQNGMFKTKKRLFLELFLQFFQILSMVRPQATMPRRLM